MKETINMFGYYDQYGRIHEKEGKISNNGWIYTAYLKRAGGHITASRLAAHFCSMNLQRHPFMTSFPPMSFDEVLGLAYLLGKDFNPSVYENSYTYIPLTFKKPQFKLIQFLKEAYLVFKNRNDRNYFWRTERSQTYRFTFKIPLEHRHFFLKCIGKYNPFYHFIHWIDLKLPTKDRSKRAIKYLKGKDDPEAMINYFGPEHPISKLLQNK